MLLALLRASLLPARADVAVPALFSDHMVLQCAVEIPVWGKANPGEAVVVTFAGQEQRAVASTAGRWEVKLTPLTAGTRGTLVIDGRNRIVVRDVLVGEVWLAAGQSNMQLRVDEAAGAAETKTSADLEEIRVFTVPQRPAEDPAETCGGAWVVCQPGTVGHFSAVAFYFAREIHATRTVPVGIINASWGATPIEAWTSRPAMESRPELTSLLAEASASKSTAPDAPDLAKFPTKNLPGRLFNGMIAPLVPYAIRGALWYQGENNANSNHPELYALQLPLLIQDWRQLWRQGPFPFAWVQLPNFQPKSSGATEKWPIVREAMRQTLSMPNTGMVVAIDIGEARNIHPQNKAAVGQRLARWARARVYGEAVAWSGPAPAQIIAKGSEISVTFAYADGGLVARGATLRGFEIAGRDGRWVPARARIVGAQVALSAAEVPQPTTVRYAWADNPDCNLFNGIGLPASPFLERANDGIH